MNLPKAALVLCAGLAVTGLASRCEAQTFLSRSIAKVAARTGTLEILATDRGRVAVVGERLVGVSARIRASFVPIEVQGFALDMDSVANIPSKPSNSETITHIGPKLGTKPFLRYGRVVDKARDSHIVELVDEDGTKIPLFLTLKQVTEMVASLRQAASEAYAMAHP